MTEARAGCNPRSGAQTGGADRGRRSGAKRVGDDLDPPDAVDKGDVKAHLAVLPGGKGGDEFKRGGADAGDLAGAEAVGGAREIGGRFHLDKDRHRAVGADQVDFSALAAPAAGEDAQALPLKAVRDTVFGGQPAELRKPSGQSFAASFRAI